MNAAALFLILAVAAVGVLHTAVPDHWLPIALKARERGWSQRETARAAAQAGAGHVLSTLAIALAVWIAGAAFAERYGRVVDFLSSLALIGFGGWIAVCAWREIEPADRPEPAHPHPHSHHHSHHRHSHHRHDTRTEAGETARDDGWLGLAAGGNAALAAIWSVEDDPLYVPLGAAATALTRHAHLHRHGRGAPHLHWHDHSAPTAHPVLAAFAADPPFHRHRHKTTARTALLLILGSSPMVEGIPAFFAAGKYGAGLVAAMAAIFAASTIATYVALCTGSGAGLQALRLGRLERYGEVLSGAVIAAAGVIFGLWPGF